MYVFAICLFLAVKYYYGEGLVYILLCKVTIPRLVHYLTTRLWATISYCVIVDKGATQVDYHT